MGWKGKSTIEQSWERVAKLDKERRSIERKEGRAVPKLEDLSLGEAREFELSILHIDIDDFKEVTGDLTMVQMMRFGSIFLTEMTSLVKEFEGAVEKYVGDSVTALFGAGYEAAKAAENCLNCALTMLTIIKFALNPYLKQQNLPTFTCSVGMDLGDTWIERVGIKGESQFTLVGHPVSIAAQLRDLGAPNQILLGAGVYRNLADSEKKHCEKLSPAADWTWVYKGTSNSYPYYRYTGYWLEYPLH